MINIARIGLISLEKEPVSGVKAQEAVNFISSLGPLMDEKLMDVIKFVYRVGFENGIDSQS